MELVPEQSRVLVIAVGVILSANVCLHRVANFSCNPVTFASILIESTNHGWFCTSSVGLGFPPRDDPPHIQFLKLIGHSLPPLGKVLITEEMKRHSRGDIDFV